MPFREFAESIVMCKAITKCYTTEMGERAKAYEKAQRAGGRRLGQATMTLRAGWARPPAR